jgi:hypothetical protein
MTASPRHSPAPRPDQRIGEETPAKPTVVRFGFDVLDRVEQAVAMVKERLKRSVSALEAAGVPYAVVGGHAVAAWVSQIDPAAVRTTVDVDILIARVARETFGVQHVVARIYDPKRAIVYERLGIPTVASVAWTSARVLRTVLPHGSEVEWTDPTSTYVLVERRVPPTGAGRSVADVELAGGRVCLLTRSGHAQVPATALLLQEDDLIQVMTPSDAIDAIDAVLTGTHEGAH